MIIESRSDFLLHKQNKLPPETLKGRLGRDAPARPLNPDHVKDISILGSLSNSVFERRTSTESGLFASLGSGLVESLGLIVFIREKKLSNTNFLASRHMYSEKASLPVDVRQTSFLTSKLPISTPYHVILCNLLHIYFCEFVISQ